VPDKIKSVLSQSEKIFDISRSFRFAHSFYYLGRGFNFPVALEGALKLKEVSYIHAEGLAAAEMKHGPIALIDKLMPVVVIAPSRDPIYEKIRSNLEEVRKIQSL
jgi:glucosamine--fructose-6-phosphate aminotransferase (isomerizing)